MKISLVVPRDPPGKNNFYQVPIGALYTAERLRRRGSDVAFYDLRVEGTVDRCVYSEIADADLAVVLSNDYDLAQCYPSLRPTASCIAAIRDAGGALVACAGSHATVHASLTRSFTGADIAIAGEVEFAVPDLADVLESGGRPPERWPAVGVRLADERELSELSGPAYDLAPMGRYFSEGFVGNELDRVNSGLVMANRGCPFACPFCYLLFGRRLRRRPVAATLSELSSMHDKHGVRHFFFLDYTFTIDKRWVDELCSGIERAGLANAISWICQTRVDCLDDAILERMKNAGCSGVWLGIESPELEQRRYLGKGRLSFAAIEDGIASVRRAGIQALAFVMVGLPNETESTLASLNRWLSQSKVYYSLSTFQTRLGAPIAEERAEIVMAGRGWDYLDSESEFLGESSLRRADLGWFFEFHDESPTRVANIMRWRLAHPREAAEAGTTTGTGAVGRSAECP